MDKEVLKRVIYGQHQVIRDATIVDRDFVFEKKANYVLVGLTSVQQEFSLLYRW